VSRLALMEQGTVVAADGEMLVLERGDEIIRRIRVADVEQVLVFGSITLAPSALALLLRRGVDVVLLTPRGRYRGRVVGGFNRNVERRLAQFDRLRDPAAALAIARQIVAGKVANQRSLLLRIQREQKLPALGDAIAEMRRAQAAAASAASLDQLRGLEGQASAAYFGVFGQCIRNPAFAFGGRTRRPPRDPVNAILSFGYTLLVTAMESTVLRAGLDPMLGALHQAEFGRPSLVLDLMEEFRPILVDALALRLVNRRLIRREDFEEFLAEPGDPLADAEVGGDAAAGTIVWLADSGRRIFFRAWGQRFRETHWYDPRAQTLTFEQILRQQVYHFARVVMGEEAVYVPFTVR
jgi:CRISPR-associated protein Cas1